MIRILLADDQALLRSTFRMLIDSCDDMTVTAEAANGQEAVDRARAHRPDRGKPRCSPPGRRRCHRRRSG